MGSQGCNTSGSLKGEFHVFFFFQVPEATCCFGTEPCPLLKPAMQHFPDSPQLSHRLLLDSVGTIWTCLRVISGSFTTPTAFIQHYKRTHGWCGVLGGAHSYSWLWRVQLETSLRLESGSEERYGLDQRRKIYPPPPKSGWWGGEKALGCWSFRVSQ